MKITREQLVENGIALFKQYGYENVSVDRICKESSVTKGSFYHYFHSKADLLLNYYNVLLKNGASFLMPMLNTSTCYERLWIAFEYAIDATVSLGPELLKNLLAADIAQGNILVNPYGGGQKEEKDYRAFLVSLIEHGQKEETIRSDVTAEDLLFAYLSGLTGIALNWSAGGGKYDEKAELKRLFVIIFGNC